MKILLRSRKKLLIKQEKKENSNRLLAVGINHYPGIKERLDYAVSDAEKFSEEFSNIGFQSNLLTDYKSSKSIIFENLIKEVLGSSPGDNFIFFFAGHGATYADGGRFIIARGDREKNEIISIDEINEILKFHNGNAYVIFDICSDNLNLEYDYLPYRYSKKIKYKNIKYLFGSSLGEITIEDSRLKSGIFTYTLLEYARKNKKELINKININKILKYSSDRVSSLAKLYGYEAYQTPSMSY